MTATAMAASQISGRHIDPSQLDQLLDRNGGYSGDALNWDVAARQFGLTQRAIDLRTNAGMSDLNSQLDAGRPVVVGVDYKSGSRGGANGTDHWITLTGRARTEDGQTVYYANDPAGGRRITLVEQNGRLVEQNPPAGRRAYTTTGPGHIFVGGRDGTPATAGAPAPVTGTAEAELGAEPETTGTTATLEAAGQAGAVEGGRYTIQRGDTLSELAQRFGVSVQDLVRANGIQNPDLIYAGAELIIPGRSGQVTAGAELPESDGAPQVSGDVPAAPQVGATPGAAPVPGGGLDLRSEFSDPNSTLSVAIGHAEGNRTVSGGFTDSYHGHDDPGNDARNLGTFSYQIHQSRGVDTPAEADEVQLRRLRAQIPIYEAAVRRAGLDPSNPRLQAAYFDLWNQSPRMAERFLARLPQQLAGREITVETLAQARLNACFDDNGRFTSTGLRNPERAYADQLRRERALEAVLEARGLV